MADTKPPLRPTPAARPKSSSGSSFPLLALLFSVAMMAAAVVSFLNIYLIPKLAMEIAFAIGGLFLFLLSLSESSGHRRRELLKKYI